VPGGGLDEPSVLEPCCAWSTPIRLAPTGRQKPPDRQEDALDPFHIPWLAAAFHRQNWRREKNADGPAGCGSDSKHGPQKRG
jgi:hypothetical protein